LALWQITDIHHLENFIFHRDILSVDQHEGRNKIVFLLAERTTSEQSTIVDVHGCALLTFLVSNIDGVGLMRGASGAEEVGKDIRVEEVDG